MEKYQYTIKPRIPIRNMIPGKLFNREATLALTLNEVKVALKHGPVYRRFANSGEVVQVTLDNCERLHNRDYVEQHVEMKDAVEFIPTEDEKTPIVENEVVVTEPTVVETVEDEVVTEPTVIEVPEVVEEVVTASETEDDAIEEVKEDEAVVETVEEEATEEVKTVEQRPNNNNHNHHKKKK